MPSGTTTSCVLKCASLCDRQRRRSPCFLVINVRRCAPPGADFECRRVKLLARQARRIGEPYRVGILKFALHPYGKYPLVILGFDQQLGQATVNIILAKTCFSWVTSGNSTVAEATELLSRLDAGDDVGAAQLLPLVYTELRKLAAQQLAQERPGQTLQATALVHEAYLRLVGGEPIRWNSQGHFFAAAAEAMRRILVERARRKLGPPRGDRQRCASWIKWSCPSYPARTTCLT